MSFSLWTWLAQASQGRERKFPATAQTEAGKDASAIHGQPRRSGCTPAEPYPPGGSPRLIQNTTTRTWGKSLILPELYENQKTEQLTNKGHQSVTHVLNLKCYRCPDQATAPIEQ